MKRNGKITATLPILLLFSFAMAEPDPPQGMAPAAHPTSDSAQERAVWQAALDGTPAQPVAKSARILLAISNLGNHPVPTGEQFALIKITDRETGERVMFTRGKPDPEFNVRLDDPASNAPELVYAEQSSLRAEGGVEIAIRSQIVMPSELEDPAAAVASEPFASEDEEETHRLRIAAADSPYPFRVDQDLRRHLEALRKDGAVASKEMIPVAIELLNIPEQIIPRAEDITEGGHLWAGLALMAERERTIADRKMSIRTFQQPVEAAVRAAGGKLHYSSWMTGTVDAFLTPDAIVQIAASPGVRSIEFIPEFQPMFFFTGIDTFDSTHQEAFSSHNGYNSAGGHSYTSRLTIGMAEECIRESAPAWKNNTPTSWRRARFYDIDPLGHTLGSVENCWGDGDGKKYEHGHWVASMMVADFMDGQDPSLTTTERRQRTGTCPECYLTFFQDENLNNIREAYDRACDKGVDIFQSSIGSNSLSCNGNGSRDVAIQSLTKNCGVLFVQSAGNNNSDTGSCTTSYPADHPWTLTVGGVKTDTPCDDDSRWFTSDCIYDPGASRGGAEYNGHNDTASVIDLAAPYRVYALDPDINAPATLVALTGTSFSSPIVAGLAGRMMDFWKSHADTSVFHSNRMKTMMLLFGDRSIDHDGQGRTTLNSSRLWGLGRVTMFPFDDSNGWHIWRGSVYLHKKDAYSFDLDLPSGVKMLKAVVWHDGKNYANEPKIKLEVDPGGGCNRDKITIEESDSKAMQFRDVNNCTTAHIRIRNSPVGFSGSRRFHYAIITTRATSERAW